MRARLALLVGAVLVFTSCVGSDPSNGGGALVPLDVRLLSFSSCDEFLSYVKDHGIEHVTPWGLPGQAWGPWLRIAGAEGDVALGAAEVAPAPVPGADYSTTNLQTAGVDELDIVKTDGERLVVRRRVVD